MPIKYAKTQVTVERGTGRKTTKNFYMHMEKIEDLIAEYNKTQGVRGKGKLRQKIKGNENMYSWKFQECATEECKEILVKQFLKQLFKVEL